MILPPSYNDTVIDSHEVSHRHPALRNNMNSKDLYSGEQRPFWAGLDMIGKMYLVLIEFSQSQFLSSNYQIPVFQPISKVVG